MPCFSRSALARALALALALALAALPLAAEPEAPQGIDRLAWLAGCWASVDGEAGTMEQWMPPAGGTMMGAGRQVRESRTVGFEFLLIREVSAGGLEYVARPSGESATVFSLSTIGPREVGFTNPTHDFPKTISYRMENDHLLRARIEGAPEDDRKPVDFFFKPIPCAAES